MAKFNGNIFNRAAGSIGGNTFSQARYRGGKLQTARQRVSPSNPRTNPQKIQRSRVKLVSSELKQINFTHAREAFRNSVAKLPSFQALQKILIDATKGGVNSAFFNQTPHEVISPGIHIPATINASQSAGVVTFTWSTENSNNGKATDRVYILYFGFQADDRDNNNFYAHTVPTTNRGAGSQSFTPAVSPSHTAGWLFALFLQPLDTNSHQSTSNVKFSRFEL